MRCGSLHALLAKYEIVCQKTFDKGGNVVIPSFAVGRTQEMLYLLRTIKEQNLIHGHDNFPVYVDSPLAVEATRIYASGLTGYYDKETLSLLQQGIDPIVFPDLKLSVTSDESKLINADKVPKVILSASGMCEAGRIRHHLKHNLWRKESTVLFVGYQVANTIGRKLLDGASSVRLFGEDIAVHANVTNLDGISGHADREMLINWLGHMTHTPQMVFVNHGDDQVCDSFAALLGEKLGLSAVAPYSGDGYDLATGECFQKGVITPSKKYTEGRKRATMLYERLLQAMQRLRKIVEGLKEAPNREIIRLTDQINTLCEKYKR